MSIRDVTFEELLTILRSSPELVAKTAVENLRRDDIDHARRDARESRGNDRRPASSQPCLCRAAPNNQAADGR